MTNLSAVRPAPWASNTTTSANKVLVNNEFCTVIANAGNTVRTISLPSSPSAGWKCAISVGNFSNTVVARNTKNIQSAASNLTINYPHTTVILKYIDASIGWQVQ